MLHQYDFQKDEENYVFDLDGNEIIKKETKEMRFYNRFSKEFGTNDVSVKDGDHHNDHMCHINFNDIMDNIFLSMIPYQLK